MRKKVQDRITRLEARTIVRPAAADLIGRLQTLASELAARGFAAHLSTARHPCVRVVNRQATALSELIYAARYDADGFIWFWWSWAERICPADDPQHAAGKIAHVLTPQGLAIGEDAECRDQHSAGARLESSSL
jgi:hypothetical protein